MSRFLAIYCMSFLYQYIFDMFFDASKKPFFSERIHFVALDRVRLCDSFLDCNKALRFAPAPIFFVLSVSPCQKCPLSFFVSCHFCPHTFSLSCQKCPHNICISCHFCTSKMLRFSLLWLKKGAVFSVFILRFSSVLFTNILLNVRNVPFLFSVSAASDPQPCQKCPYEFRKFLRLSSGFLLFMSFLYQ